MWAGPKIHRDRRSSFALTPRPKVELEVDPETEGRSPLVEAAAYRANPKTTFLEKVVFERSFFQFTLI